MTFRLHLISGCIALAGLLGLWEPAAGQQAPANQDGRRDGPSPQPRAPVTISDRDAHTLKLRTP